MAWLKLRYRTAYVDDLTVGYFNSDHIYMIHPYDGRTKLHLNVPDKDGHRTKVVEEPIEVVAALLDVENPNA